MASGGASKKRRVDEGNMAELAEGMVSKIASSTWLLSPCVNSQLSGCGHCATLPPTRWYTVNTLGVRPLQIMRAVHASSHSIPVCLHLYSELHTYLRVY